MRHLSEFLHTPNGRFFSYCLSAVTISLALLDLYKNGGELRLILAFAAIALCGLLVYLAQRSATLTSYLP